MIASAPDRTFRLRPRFIAARLSRTAAARTERSGGALAAAGRVAVALAFAAGLMLVLGGMGTAAHTTPGRYAASGASPQPVAGTTAAPRVVILPASGTVDDVMADYIAGGIQRAVGDGASAVVIQLDTLGGSEAAMVRIMQSLHARIPTIVWVGPSSARAMSAGTFVTLAANLAYMAPGTTIGAASPVTSGGGDIGATYGQTEAAKVMNYAVALIESTARERHPDAVDWATTTVKDAKAYSANDALAAHGINGVVSSIDDLLAAADGQVVLTSAGQAIVHTRGATQVTISENAVQTVMHALDDPNIAFILLVLGVVCVLLEFFHPTVVVGLLGAFSLVLSFYGSGNLPLNIVGVLLVVMGVIMLALEPSVPSHGLLAIGGLLSFLVGAVVFYGEPPGPYQPAVSVAWPVIALMTVGAVAFAFIIIRTALELRRRPVWAGRMTVGSVKVVGEEGEVRADLDPFGTVFVCGEEWSARAEGVPPSLPRGTKVRVLRRDGLMLVVAATE